MPERPGVADRATLDSEIARLDTMIDAEMDKLNRGARYSQWLLDEWCAAYQALCWARDPEGHAAPSRVHPSPSVLRLVKG